MVAVKSSPDCEGQTLSLVEELRSRTRRQMRMRMLGSWRMRRKKSWGGSGVGGGGGGGKEVGGMSCSWKLLHVCQNKKRRLATRTTVLKTGSYGKRFICSSSRRGFKGKMMVRHVEESLWGWFAGCRVPETKPETTTECSTFWVRVRPRAGY